MVKNPSNAIYRRSNYGPIFGAGFDIYIANNANSNTIYTQTWAPLTLFQVEYKTGKQSWLGLTTLHLIRWRCSILAEAVSFFDQFFH